MRERGREGREQDSEKGTKEKIGWREGGEEASKQANVAHKMKTFFLLLTHNSQYNNKRKIL